MSKHLLLEKYIEAIRLQGGINTNLPVTLNGTAATLSVGGTSTFTGVATFTASPVFSSAVATKMPVVDMTSSTAAPTAAQSGSLFLFDRAAGITVTLPTPVVGVQYDFVVVATVTAASYKIITDAGTTLIAGTLVASSDNLASKSFLGNGTTHIAITQAAASSNATGGIIGSWLRLTCVSSTLWTAVGQTVASATPTTPFATS